jgi:hypothetical protein
MEGSHLTKMPADAEPTLRPEIAQILSLDVVGYSELPVNQQVDLLNQLNQRSSRPPVSAPRGEMSALVGKRKR